MEHRNTLEQVLHRHRAFWTMEEVDKPLISVGRYQPTQPRQPFALVGGSLVQEGTIILPELVDAKRLVEHIGEPSSVVNGDFIRGTGPYDLCWTEAIVGCPIRWRSGHVWSEPFLEDINHLGRLNPTPDNPWLSKLLETTQRLVEKAAGNYPVCQPLLRGPIDIASAALGDEPLCWAMMDEPDQFKQLLAICTDLFITVAKTWCAASPAFQDGYCMYGIWTPGATVRTQCDDAALLSPDLYQEFLIPCDERICAAFDYPLIHTHSGVLHIAVDALLELESLRAIQVSLDYPAGPSATALLPTFQRINRQKPLIITGGLAAAELDLLLNTLSPRGLCLQVSIHD
jgi:uroporphyrinogen-III decarboxylase